MLKSVLSIVIQIVFYGGLLLAPAGKWGWGRAWVVIGMMEAVTAAAVIGVFRKRPDLLNERYKPIYQRGQPLADKVILTLLVLSYCGLVAFIPLDVFRFQLLGRPGPVVSGLGLALLAGALVVTYLTFRENAFAAAVVRYQEERQQTVVDSGVYGVVRHPMYAAGIVQFVGMPLWLGSYAAALLASVPAVFLILRIGVEERLLRRKLAGYEAYRRRVRYRLIPGVW